MSSRFVNFVCRFIEYHLIFFRFEQTTAEAKKIAEVKEELQKLDAELAADVTILRREIEAAALNYAHYKYVLHFRQLQIHRTKSFAFVSGKITIESNLNF